MGKKIRRIIVVATCCVVGVFIYVCFGVPGRGEKVSVDLPAMSNDGMDPLQGCRVLVSLGEKKGDVFISWQADKDGPRNIKYAEDENDVKKAVPIRASRTEVLRNMYRFKVKLTELEPGKEYFYEIGDAFDERNHRSFVVPETNDEVIFSYLGDPQFDKAVRDYDDWGKLTTAMYDRTPYIDFAVIGGDMVNLPTRKDHWNGFLDNCTVFEKLPVMTIPGNHEGVASNNTYKKIFHNIDNGLDGEAFYYFDRGVCRFIMLDSSFLTRARQVAMGQEAWKEREGEIEKWVKRTLKESPARWNIIVTHHPIYGMHDVFTVSKELRALWLPALKDGGADLVLCGHQHVYMRTREMDGMVHVMGMSGAKRSKYYTGLNEPAYSKAIYSAGPNYQIIRADSKSLEITSYNEKGSIIDAAVIDKDTRAPYFRTFW